MLGGAVPGDCVEDEHDSSIDHIPLVPCQAVYCVRNEVVVLDADAFEQGALPETTATKDGC